MRKTIAVIFGGRSGEHEISIRSARSVIEQIDSSKYNIVPIAISNDGRWLSTSESLALMPMETQDAFAANFGGPDGNRYVLLGDATAGGLVAVEPDGLTPSSSAPSSIDCVFPVLHGTYGEDGTIQGLLEMADIPYVGCGVLASATGMDKAFMKTLFRDAGLPMCKYTWFLRDQWAAAKDAFTAKVEAELGYPCFVKPANLGSSVGISRAAHRESLDRGIALAAEYDRKIIVEEALEMREIECAVLGNDNPEASLPGEYIIRDESKVFLDFTEKYSGTGNNEFVVPAPVSEDLSNRIREMSVRAFKAIDGSGLARVDFFLRRDNGELLINEVNTMPGLTDASGYPKMWEGTGRSFPEVIDRLIDCAFERHADKRRNKTTRV
jgi:D-alanine-D-alanine ligase